jgi:hypothetical protein
MSLLPVAKELHQCTCSHHGYIEGYSSEQEQFLVTTLAYRLLLIRKQLQHRNTAPEVTMREVTMQEGSPVTGYIALLLLLEVPPIP